MDDARVKRKQKTRFFQEKSRSEMKVFLVVHFLLPSFDSWGLKEVCVGFALTSETKRRKAKMRPTDRIDAVSGRPRKQASERKRQKKNFFPTNFHFSLVLFPKVCLLHRGRFDGDYPTALLSSSSSFTLLGRQEEKKCSRASRLGT